MSISDTFVGDHTLTGLLLVVTANASPWIASRIFGRHFAAPLDFGLMLRDRTRLLGSHKTWRGLISGAAACGVVTQFLHLGFALGAAFGTLALIADAASSYVKRRLQVAPGTEVAGLDQLPEALLPLLVLSQPLEIGFVESLGIATLFIVLDIAATKLRHV